MSQNMIREFENLPFCIGPQATPDNPSGLPNTFTFNLYISPELGRIEQVNSPELEKLLGNAYQLGIEMGIPTDDTELGGSYARDFLSFIQAEAPLVGRALEIGAGVGYISSQLLKIGWNVDSIEPGKGYEAYWKKYELDVINDFFPNDQAQGHYDLIVFYTVLEHISSVDAFLKAVSEQLAPNGIVILGVPDCTTEIESGDPSILLHEHYQYFTLPSLSRVLKSAGFDPKVRKSGYGRSIYASAKLNKGGSTIISPSSEEGSMLNTYCQKVHKLEGSFERVLKRSLAIGSVGIFCPARTLALLPQDVSVRFFDDSNALHGSYYPPFQAVIESREDLLRDPVETLLVMSWTFGDKLSKEIGALLPEMEIYTMDDFL